MNTVIEQQNNGSIKPSNLADWLISHGIVTITTAECAHLLRIEKDEVPQRLMRYREKGQFISLARGMWAVVSPEYREMGAPEPISYIDSLMNYSNCDYCIGWLTAAALYGASHQAPQVFQIATDRNMINRTVGRSSLHFYVRSYIHEVTRKRISLPQGAAYVAAPGVVMLMVASDILLCGGIDNVATVVTELATENQNYMSDLLSCADLFPLSAARRLGWILENVAEEDDMDDLAAYCGKSSNPAMLSPYDTRCGQIDARWNVIVNRKIEADI